ncbi:protein O-linked-mannose beta-1,4-N-acetylglucosaminyltransferase 2-like protein [Carex littledalei]|uniref:Protein O-linked-mannose beta-1,4-N-acetylglucosaminyltransferase 2-like protein n=1 Tax=Carex littledalei TaxID=544730 RepID=A0A833QSQ0_9POAL|nr:protein O-linked-mannose beta-1,4-N-acetylglucosaminyltransferase 2-like protein [Carex littledalei]
MKGGGGLLGRYDTQKFGCGVMVKCLLFAMVVLSVLNPAVLPSSIFQSKWTINQPVSIEEEPNFGVSNSDHTKLALRLLAKTKSQNEDETPTTEIILNKSKLIYNSANPRYNICSIEGDIRIVSNASTIFIVSPTPLNPNTTTWKIKPYPRKWESYCMSSITEMTIQQLTDANQTRSCDVNHDLPAVVFSTARFTGNLFHDYTDMIYPLFLATQRYNGEVKLVVEDYVSKCIEKYQPYLTRLSHYPIINIDTGSRVHCFSSAQVGLENPGPLGYKFENPQNDQAMQQFRRFIRESLYLERSEVEKGKKPRLLVLIRKNTRLIINEDDVMNLAKDVGFEVVTADEETTKDFPGIAHIVNSCDVLMGIHGAGLANMLYLPANGTVLQITPFGNLKWVGRFDYGDPPRGFGFRYVEYEITLDESTLIEKYPRDHPWLRVRRKGNFANYIMFKVLASWVGISQCMASERTFVAAVILFVAVFGFA